MGRQIFVTGGSGFIGENLIQRQAIATERRVKVLTRFKSDVHPSTIAPIEQIVGDLLERETYQAALDGCDTVVHLAAATGRATPQEYHRVNVEGTRTLLQACKTAGVRQFLHVSTIAAGYPNQRFYHYAKTKAQAEALVRESGLDFIVVRPTLVLGEKSPIWKTLVKIAGLPVIPLPESHPVRVQPIHVNDVVRGLEHLLARDRFEGDVLELGGPRSMSFREFLQLIQVALRDAPGKITSVPLTPIRLALAAIEPVLRPLMPVTAGQLSVFANDSIASENWLLKELRASMPSTEDTIAALVSAGVKAGGGGQTPEPQRVAMPLSERAQLLLKEECRSFATYLVGRPPSAYVEERYIMAAQAHGLARDENICCFDRASLTLARRGRIFARWADAFCALFCRSGALRRKLVLLAAILEHVAPTNEAFDRADPSNSFRTVLSLASYGVISVVSLLLGAAVLLPASVLCWTASFKAGTDVRTGQAQ